MKINSGIYRYNDKKTGVVVSICYLFSSRKIENEDESSEYKLEFDSDLYEIQDADGNGIDLSVNDNINEIIDDAFNSLESQPTFVLMDACSNKEEEGSVAWNYVNNKNIKWNNI